MDGYELNLSTHAVPHPSPCSPKHIENKPRTADSAGNSRFCRELTQNQRTCQNHLLMGTQFTSIKSLGTQQNPKGNMREQMQNQKQNANSTSQSEGSTRVAFLFTGEILPKSEIINQKFQKWRHFEGFRGLGFFCFLHLPIYNHPLATWKKS